MLGVTDSWRDNTGANPDTAADQETGGGSVKSLGLSSEHNSALNLADSSLTTSSGTSGFSIIDQKSPSAKYRPSGSQFMSKYTQFTDPAYMEDFLCFETI